jgi:hypothetical protein
MEHSGVSNRDLSGASLFPRQNRVAFQLQEERRSQAHMDTGKELVLMKLGDAPHDAGIG